MQPSIDPRLNRDGVYYLGNYFQSFSFCPHSACVSARNDWESRSAAATGLTWMQHRHWCPQTPASNSHPSDLHHVLWLSPSHSPRPPRAPTALRSLDCNTAPGHEMGLLFELLAFFLDRTNKRVRYCFYPPTRTTQRQVPPGGRTDDREGELANKINKQDENTTRAIGHVLYNPVIASVTYSGSHLEAASLNLAVHVCTEPLLWLIYSTFLFFTACD